MKQLLLVMLVSVSTILSAQKIKVSESSDKIAEGTNNVMKVMIYEADKSTIEKEWKSWMKKGDAKVSMKSEISAIGGTFKSLGEKEVDIYAKIDQKGDGFELTVGVDLGGAFLKSDMHPEQYKAFAEELEKFAKKTTEDAVDALVKEAEKAVKEEEKNLDKLKSDKSSLENDIKKYEESIQKAKDDIKTNEKDQVDTEAKLEEKKKALEQAKSKINKFQ